jgi:hypothetical protein
MKFSVIGIVLMASAAIAFAQWPPYPGDDWVFYKPNGTEDIMVKDYAACISSPSAPPTLTKQGRLTTNTTQLLTYQRYILSCMGAKGYMLKPPPKK